MSLISSTFVEQSPTIFHPQPSPSQMIFANNLMHGVPTTRLLQTSYTNSGGSLNIYLVNSNSNTLTTVPSTNLANVTMYAQPQPNCQYISYIPQPQNPMIMKLEEDKKILIPNGSCTSGLHAAVQLHSHVFPSSVPVEKCQSVLRSSKLHSCKTRCASKPDSAFVASNVCSNDMPVIATKQRKKDNFPTILYKVLMDARSDGREDIICFHPHGRSFIVNDIKKFERELMRKYFDMSSWRSFRRQLNLYDFIRVPCGHDAGSYYHKYFVQGSPHLLNQIKRTRLKGERSKNLPGYKAPPRPNFDVESEIETS